MNNPKADNLLLFKSIVDNGSLSAGAKASHISVSQASKRMAHLERSLGVKLLERSTRKMSLTAPGTALYNRLTPIESQLEEAWESMYDYRETPKGEIKISCPIFFGLNTLIPFTTQFNKEHPEIHVNLSLGHKEENVEGTGFDLKFISHALSPNELIPDSGLHAKRIHSKKLVYVASIDYLTHHGTPKTPQDIQEQSHRCLSLKHKNAPKTKAWTFYENNTPSNQPINVVFEANTYEALSRAVDANMGIALLPESLVDTSEGNVAVLFEDYAKDTLDTYVYFTKHTTPSKKIQLFLSSLITQTTKTAALK